MKFEITGPVADADVAWRVLGDSDGLNRVAGNAALVARVEHGPEGPQVIGEMVGPMGIRMPFRETGGWVDGRWFTQERTFSSGPLSRSTFRMELVPEGRGVRPVMRLELEGPLAFRPLLAASMRRIQHAWQGVLDGLPAPGTVERRPQQRLPDEVTIALGRWKGDVSPRLFDALRDTFVTGTALELQALRAFELADRWGLDREEVLVGFLRAVRSGVLELYWSVRCTRCKSEVSASTSLSDLADHAACSSCDVSFDNDLGTNVEVLFAPHPGLLPRVEQTFCSFFPAGSPEIRSALVVPAGGAVDETLVLGPGRFWLGTGGSDVEVVVGSTGADGVRWTPGAEGRVEVVAGRVTLHIENPGSVPVRVVLIADDDGLDAVPASFLTSLPEFRREMSDQLLAPDVRISNRSVCLLFTDLSGSTAMFEALGDAVAYGLVAQHFRVLQEVLDAHRGVLVKTIGDAVMASFHSVHDGFLAALAMREAFEAWTSTLELEAPPRLNVGLHVGPALVVHSDAHGLDYFGRTVNLAARAQSAASEGELSLTEAVLEADPRIAARVAQLPRERVVVPLKGIGDVPLVKLPL